MQRAGRLQGALLAGETGMQQRGPGVAEPASPLRSDILRVSTLRIMSGLVREVPEPSKHRVMEWALAAEPREVGQPRSSWMLAEQAAARGSTPSKGVRLGVAGEEETGKAVGLCPLTGPLHAPLSLQKLCLLDILVGQALGPGQVASRPHPDGIHVAELGQACLWPFIHGSSQRVALLLPRNQPFLCWPEGQHPLPPWLP